MLIIIEQVINKGWNIINTIILVYVINADSVPPSTHFHGWRDVLYQLPAQCTNILQVSHDTTKILSNHTTETWLYTRDENREEVLPGNCDPLQALCTCTLVSCLLALNSFLDSILSQRNQCPVDSSMHPSIHPSALQLTDVFSVTSICRWG